MQGEEEEVEKEEGDNQSTVEQNRSAIQNLATELQLQQRRADEMIRRLDGLIAMVRPPSRHSLHENCDLL